MQFQHHGITVSVGDEDVRRLVIERLALAPLKDIRVIASSSAPAIGSEWGEYGGIYAGIARGRDGGTDYHLVVGVESDGQLTWDAASKWAAGLGPFGLPFRKEQALCFANVPELFKPEAYWSCEQHASCSGCAWSQYFSYGFQLNWFKSTKLRARLVRRLAIQ